MAKKQKSSSMLVRENEPLPQKEVGASGSLHDGPISEKLVHLDFTMAMDRAFGKIERLDRFNTSNQYYVLSSGITFICTSHAP